MSQTADIETLFRAHYRALCLYALHYVGDLATAEDLVMDSFVRLFERTNSPSLQSKASPFGMSSASEGRGGGSQPPIIYTKSYLFQMVRNASIDHLRRLSADGTPDSALPLDALADVPDPTPDEEQALQERSAREARLWAAIDHLPHACRNILLLSKRDGLKNREIAEALGLSLKTVEAQLTKAYATLRGKAREIYLLLF